MSKKPTIPVEENKTSTISTGQTQNIETETMNIQVEDLAVIENTNHLKEKNSPLTNWQQSSIDELVKVFDSNEIHQAFACLNTPASLEYFQQKIREAYTAL